MVKVGVTPDRCLQEPTLLTGHPCPVPEPSPHRQSASAPIRPLSLSIVCGQADILAVLRSHCGSRILHGTSLPTQLLPPLASKPFGDYSSVIVPGPVSITTQGPNYFICDEGIYEPGNPLGWWVLKDSFTCSLFLVSF